jgi:hypothetical protein
MTEFSCLCKDKKLKRQLTPGKSVMATKITKHEILIKELFWRVYQCLQKVLKGLRTAGKHVIKKIYALL